MSEYRFHHWILHDWSRAGLVTAIMLLSLAPMVYLSAGLVVLLIYVWLPLYMLHQYEEHAQGTFLEYYRRMMPGIAPYLSEQKLLIVNIGAVWLLFLISLYASFFNLFWLALYPPCVSLINAFMHLGQALRWRAYNPGLWTALFLFLPGAALTIFILSKHGATRGDTFGALGLALLAHVFLFALGRGWIAKSL